MQIEIEITNSKPKTSFVFDAYGVDIMKRGIIEYTKILVNAKEAHALAEMLSVLIEGDDD